MRFVTVEYIDTEFKTNNKHQIPRAVVAGKSDVPLEFTFAEPSWRSTYGLHPRHRDGSAIAFDTRTQPPLAGSEHHDQELWSRGRNTRIGYESLPWSRTFS